MVGRFAVAAALAAVLVGHTRPVAVADGTGCSADGGGTCATNESAAAAVATYAPSTAAPRPTVGVRYDVPSSGHDANVTREISVVTMDDGRRAATFAVPEVADRRPAVADDKAPIATENVTAGGDVGKSVGNSTAAGGAILRTTTAGNPLVNGTPTATSRVPPTDDGGQPVRFVANKYCYCDRMDGGCDVNCCCDTECGERDLKAFTSCAEHTTTATTVKSERILFDSTLFHVVIDNVPSNYFYPERNAIKSESQMASSMRNRDAFTWPDAGGQPRRPPEPVGYGGYDLTYKSTRWMYTVVHSAGVQTFALTSGAVGSLLCSAEQPVEYLAAKETRCRTFVSSLPDACVDGSALSFRRYYGENGTFKAVRPNDSNNTNNGTARKTEKFDLATVHATARHHCADADGSPYDCSAESPSHGPVYAAGVCHRAVVAVEYRVVHDGARGVRAMDVRFRHRDVRDTGRPIYIDQRFEVRFVGWTAAVDRKNGTESLPYERSGKPGYATGAPVLRASAPAADNGAETRGRGRNRRPKPMDLPEPDERGGCETAGPRLPVNFLENVDVRCRVRVVRRRFNRTEQTAAALCHAIQNETVSALGDYDGVSVASLGDPDVAEWVPAVVVKPPAVPYSPSDDSCAAITDQMHVRVLYAQVGTFDRPRATVLGVLVNYTATTVTGFVTETLRDDGADAAEVTAAVVPIRATVMFVDLTRPPVRTFAEPPTYEFKLPEDFYYPFWSSDDRASSSAASDVRLERSPAVAFALFAYLTLRSRAVPNL